MVAAQGGHHRATPRAARDGGADRVPHGQPGDRAGGRGGRAQWREVETDAATVAQRLRTLREPRTQLRQIVGEFSHYEAICERGRGRSAGAGENAAGRQEA